MKGSRAAVAVHQSAKRATCRAVVLVGLHGDSTTGDCVHIWIRTSEGTISNDTTPGSSFTLTAGSLSFPFPLLLLRCEAGITDCLLMKELSNMMCLSNGTWLAGFLPWIADRPARVGLSTSRKRGRRGLSGTTEPRVALQALISSGTCIGVMFVCFCPFLVDIKGLRSTEASSS